MIARNVDLSDYKEMFRLDPEGFNELVNAQLHREVSSYSCPNGQRVVCVQNRKLHSGRDPQAEATRFVRSTPLDGKKVVLLLGYASGYVAHAFHQKDAVDTIVYEPSISILRESIFHLPAQPGVQIITSVASLAKYFDQNRILKHEFHIATWPASARIQTKLFEEAKERVMQTATQAQLSRNTHQIRSEGWLQNYLHNLTQFATRPNLNHYANAFCGYPAVICSAGPSLSENAHHLKSLKGKCLIIAVNTAARALASMGIEAHIIVSVESLNISSQLEDVDWLPKCTAFLEITGSQEAFELDFGNIVPMSVKSDHTSAFSERLSPGQTFAAGFCVAHAALALACQLGCSGITLIGQNLAFKDGRAYAKGTSFEDIRVDQENGQAKLTNCRSKIKIKQESGQVLRSKTTDRFSFQPKKMPAWGNPEASVDTSYHYTVFARWFSEASSQLNARGIWHVNATEGGAHIENWEEKTLSETISQYELDRAPETPQDHVERKLQALGSSPGLGIQCVLQAIEDEMARTNKILSSVLKLRNWVQDDPDGDLQLTPELSTRIFDTWEKIRSEIRNTPLLEAQISRSLLLMLDRQEINTLNLALMIEAEIGNLAAAVDPVLQKLREQMAQTKAVA